MSSGDNELWLQSWREQHTDFHQMAVNPLLCRFWPGLNLVPGSRVFVPLCGKSLDMLWLAQQGHQVIGVELSPIAVEDFFAEQGLHASQERQGQFVRWQSGNITILCGDYFSLRTEDLGELDMVYDRAALTALAEDTRIAYVARLQQLITSNTRVMVMTTEDAEEGESLQQALGISSEIEALYCQHFAIQLRHVESFYERDLYEGQDGALRVEYKVYLLSSHDVV